MSNTRLTVSETAQEIVLQNIPTDQHSHFMRVAEHFGLNTPTKFDDKIVITVNTADEKDTANKSSLTLAAILELLLYSSNFEIDTTSLEIKAELFMPAPEWHPGDTVQKKPPKPTEIETLVFTYRQRNQKIEQYSNPHSSAEINASINAKIIYTKKEILAPLEKELTRLDKKLASLSWDDPKQSANARSYLERRAAICHTITEIRAAINKPQNPHSRFTWIDGIQEPINRLLLEKNEVLEKYKDKKWLRGIGNALVILFSGVIPGALVGTIKYAATGSLFFSMEGDTKNAVLRAQKKGNALLKKASGESMDDYHKEVVQIIPSQLRKDKNPHKK